MNEDLKQQVIAYLREHLYANLATINASDSTMPHVSSIAYLNDGLNLYFATTLDTEKIKNIAKNPRVALTVDEDEADWNIITGLQIEGTAEVVPERQLSAIIPAFQSKFPFSKTLPPNPATRFIRITPKKIWFLDYRKGFGHRDFMEVGEAELVTRA